MKRGVSLFEWIFCLLCYGVIISFFALNFLGTRAFTICLIIVGIAAETIFTYVTVFSWREMPIGSMYNPTGFIEVHVENICEGSRKKFMEICLDVLLYAMIYRKNIMLDTWLIREGHIKEIFGDAAKLYRPSIIQRVVNFILEKKYNKKNKRKAFRCIIYVDRLTEGESEVVVEKLRMLKSKLRQIDL